MMKLCFVYNTVFRALQGIVEEDSVIKAFVVALWIRADWL